MREVKEKSPLKARAAETLKATPQAAFRRGADASFQQLRQELREAAQDGQAENRYESSKITDTADHAVRQAGHLAEKAVHKLLKTKSEPQRKTRAESVSQHEQSRHPQQSTTASKEYPSVSARPSYPLQSQPQVKPAVRESASPIREKPVPPASGNQPKMREYTLDAKAPVTPSQYPTPRIHENIKAVSTETIPSPTACSVRETVSPIKEKPAPPANTPQPKMREYVPDTDAPVQQPQHSASQIHERPQPVHQSQINQSVRELGSSVKEKSAVKARQDAPRTADRRPKVRKDYIPAQVAEKIPAQAKKQPLGQSPAITEPAVPATTPTTPPSARILPREKPPVSSLREIPAALKTDTTQFALPEIKTKEYIRNKRQKQNLLKEEANGIENITADPETFSPVIRTRETVREQQKLHVSHSTEQEQPAMPQIRTRQPQTASMPANIEPAKPEVPRPPLPDIKSKRKYIAAQQPTQITPVQANPEHAAQQAIRKSSHGNTKLCQPPSTSEIVPTATGKNSASAKPARVQKQARPAFVKKQKIKTAPKAKIKSAAPAAKALPSKASVAAPKQAATVIRKGQVLRDTVIKTARAAKEAGKKVLRAIAAAAEKLAAAIGAGGAAAVSVVVVILLVGMLFASPLGILFAGEDTGTEIKIPDAVATLNGEFTDAIYRIMEDHPYGELDMQEGMEATMLQNWRNVLAVYAVKVSTDEEHGLEVMTMDEEKLQLLREIFFDANELVYELTTSIVDGVQKTILHISLQIKDAMQMLLQSRGRKFGKRMTQAEYPLTSRIRCSECGSFYHRKVRNGIVKWVCSKHAADTTACNSSYYSEERIYDGIITMINKLRFCEEDILGQTIQKLEFAAAAYKRNNRAASQLSQSIAELNAKLLALERLRSKGYLAADIYHTQAREIRQQLGKLKTERCSSFESRITTMMEDVRKLKSLIDELEQPLEVFDEKLFHDIVTDICINNRDEMTVTLLGGLKFTEQI